MTTERVISARIDAGLLGEVEEAAAAEDRSRNQQLAHLLRAGLAERQRRQALDAEARAAADAAARRHLQEHRRLGGIEE